MIMQSFIKINPRVYLANNAISAVERFGISIPPHTLYEGIFFQVARDSVIDFVSAQYLENEFMECIRMENSR